MRRSHSSHSQSETSDRPRRLSSSVKRRPLPDAVDTVGREFTSRLAALLQDDYLQNICEVTQDPSEVEETFHFLPITGNLFDAANKFTTTTTTTDREILSKGEKQAELKQCLEDLKLSEDSNSDTKVLKDTRIPALYSTQDFRLRHVFNSMEKEGELDSESLFRKQEELNGYLTQIQSLLTANILEQKEAFSYSVAEVEQVQEAFYSVSQQVGDIRSQIQQVNNLFCDKLSDIHQAFQAVKIGKKVLEKLEQIAEIMEAPKHVNLLVGSSDYLGALQAIEQLRNIRRNQFQNIRCLDYVESQLKTCLDDTVKVMREDFVACLDELMDEWTSKDLPVDVSWEEYVKQDVHSLSIAASHSVLNSLIMAAFHFDKLYYLVKYYVDRHFELFLENTSEIGKQSKNVADLGSKSRLVESLVMSCKEHVHRVVVVMGLVQHLIMQSTGNNDMEETDSWKQIKVRFCENISERLYEACSLILVNVVEHVDNNFKKDNWIEDQLISLEQFSLICRHLEDLSQQLCNLFYVSQSTIGGLRTFILDSCQSYFRAVHQVACKAMECLLKEEKWNALETIPDVVVSYLEEIRKIPFHSRATSSVMMNGVDAVASHPPRKDFIQLEDSDTLEETSKEEDKPTLSSSIRILCSSNSNNPSSGNAALLQLTNARCFPMTKSCSVLIKILFLYVLCLAHFPRGSMDREVVQKMVQLIRFVHQLTHRSVLSAGAIQTAGLKSISAKHLAMAYQSLQFLSQYMDMLLDALSTWVVIDPHTLSDFQKVQRELRDHQGQILAKLCSIMNERMSYHQKSIESMPWNNDSLLEQWELPSPYMQSIVRELFVLDRIFHTLGMEREWNDLSSRIISSYAEKLTNVYESLKSMGAAGRRRLVADIEFLMDNLNNMLGKERLGGYGLRNLWHLQDKLASSG